ncbi:MAG: hypothetical protein OXQ31_26545 [Spirochaetaceae bacterium]|nr:hypothetical protein [Spirochaetaceae bacterium]
MATHDAASPSPAKRKGWPRWLKILVIIWTAPIGLVLLVVIIVGIAGGFDESASHATSRPAPQAEAAQPEPAPASEQKQPASDTGKWKYQEVIDDMTKEVSLRYLVVSSNEKIDRTMKTPIRVELLVTCPEKLIILRAQDAAFHMDDLDSNGRRIQEARLIVDDGSVRKGTFRLPEDWLESDRMVGGRWGDAILTGSVLKIEVTHLVAMDPKKAVLTFDTTGWEAAFERDCPATS